MGAGLATFALEKIFEVLLLSPNAGKKWKRRKEMGYENHCRAERANCRNHDAAMSAEPMHGAILGVALPAANAIFHRNRARARARARIRTSNSSSTSTITRLHQGHACLGFRPANAGWRRVDLRTWSGIGGAESANEVAKIINQKNNSLKEGVPKQFRTKTKCQELLMLPPAGSDANASSIRPRVTAAAVPNFSVTQRTRR